MRLTHDKPSMTRHTTKLLALLACLAALPACSTLKFPGVFKIDVAQGNVINKEMIEKLKPGMTKRQVRYVMGSPLLIDTFHEDRWDYYYSIVIGDQRLVKRHVALFFENGQYVKLEGDVDALLKGTSPVNMIRQREEADPKPPKKILKAVEDKTSESDTQTSDSEPTTGQDNEEPASDEAKAEA